MIKLQCPKCESQVEIEDKEIEGSKRTVVFCKNEACFFYDHPLVGIDRGEPGVYFDESIV